MTTEWATAVGKGRGRMIQACLHRYTPSIPGLRMLVDHPRSLIVARYLAAMAQPWRSHLGILWWPPNGKHDDDIFCVGADASYYSSFCPYGSRRPSGYVSVSLSSLIYKSQAAPRAPRLRPRLRRHLRCPSVAVSLTAERSLCIPWLRLR